MEFQVVIDFIAANYQSALAIVGAFAIIATMTPNTVDNKIAQFLMDMINFLGANVNKAKNAD